LTTFLIYLFQFILMILYDCTFRVKIITRLINFESYLIRRIRPLKSKNNAFFRDIFRIL